MASNNHTSSTQNEPISSGSSRYSNIHPRNQINSKLIGNPHNQPTPNSIHSRIIESREDPVESALETKSDEKGEYEGDLKMN